MRCPNCSNDLLPAKDGGGFCAQCAEFFQASALADSSAELRYSRAAAPAARNFCQDLATRVTWPPAVFETWPGPLAHEAWRLKAILEEGQIIGAIWQLKDLAEVLLKFPAVIMARDLLEHSADEAVKSEIRSFFFSSPLSMGHWLRLAGDLLAKAVLAEHPERLMAAGLAGIFRQTSGKHKANRTYHLIREIIQWRNEELGHGALRLNVGEFQPELESFVTRLNAVFQEHEDQGLWSGLTLRINEPEPAVLHGAASIRARHENAVPGPHITEDADVALAGRDRTLVLAPFLTVKRCRVCRKMDLFFFDSKKADHFYFLDYLAGHRMARPGHLENRLTDQARDIKTVREDMDETETMGRVTRRTVDALLVEKSLEADYLSPVFLRARLRSFVESRNRGIFWLRAPAHCGKSVFVNGLLPALRVESGALTEGLKTAAFFIKREYRYHPAQFKEQLRESITGKDCLNLVAGSHELPELDLRTDDPGRAFADWIGELLKWRPEDTLLVCIDGLDELAPTDDTSILAFIPSPDQLPERLFILLTSRSQDECPDWVWHGVASKLEGFAGQESTTWAFGLDHPEYRTLLRDYFFSRLRERIHDRIHLHLKAALKENSELQFSQDAHAAPQIPIKLNPKKILADADLGGFKGGKGTAGIFETVINPVIDLFEKAFETVLEKADNRFLFVSHQVNLLRDASADLDTLERLPSGEGLFRQYINELERVFTEHQWEYAKRLLLVLAAGEEAYKTDFNLSDRAGGDMEWNGLPLGVISDLMGEPDAGSARLIFVLYSMKELLSTWRRGDQGDSLYRLGLKDFAAVIRSDWQDELVGLHREIAELFHDAWKGRFTDVNTELPGTYYCFLYLLAHAALCEDPATKDKVWSDDDLADAYRHFASRYYKRSLYRQASELFDRIIIMYSYLVNIKKDESMANDLASAYMNRGNAYQSQGRYDEAIADFGRAIGLREGLVFTNRFVQVIPSTAMAFYNAVLLTKKLDDHEVKTDIATRAGSFLEKLGLMVDVEQLPDAWRNELNDPQNLIDDEAG
jgi:tetratricopeptide (TPR) repeat protein